MENLIEINTDQMKAPVVGDDLFQNRTALVVSQQGASKFELTISIQAYNRLEKTKRCVASVLKYTKGIPFELILIDNGSTDGTLEYFQSVPYVNKKVIHVTHNIGALYPIISLSLFDINNFYCVLTNDIIVTENWMENLLACICSDPKIGMVVPVSSNTSNFQCVDLSYSNYEEMQKKASLFNRTNPQKWQERQRLITLGVLFRKEALFAIGWPFSDAGFFHDFGDDDITFRIRRMGYKAVLAGDTWICHDHDIFHGEGKDSGIFQKSLEIGRNNFRDKHFGVDAWDDVNNFYISYLSCFPRPSQVKKMEVLGVDVKCGTPILDIKNWLRTFDIYETDLSAFTQNPKYWVDLKTVCTGTVVCDREEFLADSFLLESFDYVVVDRPLNRYHEPIKILRDVLLLCRRGGYVICKLANSYSFREYLNLLGQTGVYNPEISYNISLECFQDTVQELGHICRRIDIDTPLNKESQELLSSLFPAGLLERQKEMAVKKMRCSEYLFILEKEK